MKIQPRIQPSLTVGMHESPLFGIMTMSSGCPYSTIRKPNLASLEYSPSSSTSQCGAAISTPPSHDFALSDIKWAQPDNSAEPHPTQKQHPLDVSCLAVCPLRPSSKGLQD